MIKRIVAAHDLTARGERALGRALRLRRRFGARLTVLHVVEGETARAHCQAAGRRSARADRGPTAQPRQARRPPGDRRRDRVRRRLRRHHPARQRAGHRADGAGVAQGPWRDLFFGGTIERVLRQGVTPVLTAHREAATEYARVLVAVDFSVYSRRALEFACRLVPDGEFVVLHAYDLPFAGFLIDVHPRQADLLQGEIREQIATLLREVPSAPGKIRPDVRLGAPVPVVEAAVGEFAPDLLVVGTHGRTGVAHALLGSVAERLMRRPQCDVMAVRAW